MALRIPTLSITTQHNNKIATQSIMIHSAYAEWRCAHRHSCWVSRRPLGQTMLVIGGCLVTVSKNINPKKVITLTREYYLRGNAQYS
jgi:hypothetical protein